ncbi:hypothetical protein DFP72DRAFT_1000997 [Ephemerocybe angulata]|uniref:Protein BIG1 n=1 Tax=Ephemerocybe angulata TaxID=980116 RepID=A0A8H6IE25_9AGAR|nr:hypothetical protein DFP72DRAFT_1000997 [Tulosesus angulatus]
MTRLLALLAAALPLVSAFSNTAPLLVWSSESSDAIDALPSTALQASTVLDSLLSSEQVCDYDAVVLVQQRGLHASDLRNLSPESSDLPQLLAHSPSSRTFQYLVNGDASALLSNRAQDLAKECESKLLRYSPGDSGVVLDHGRKTVVSLGLPDLKESGAARRVAMRNQERALAEELDALASVFPNHLVIYSGVPLSALSARASPHVFINDDLPEGGILKRYQILTPGLISIFLVIFFILIPVLMVGIKALAGIQNPIKMDMPKNFNAQEKKNQ